MTRICATLLGLSLLTAGCTARTRPNAAKAAPVELEQFPSPELTLTANLIQNARKGTGLELTLRNIGHRTLAIDTGLQAFPLANFQFSLELPDHQWLRTVCGVCAPGISLNPGPYTLWLKPLQSKSFTVLLATIAAEDPRTGSRVDIAQMRGLLYITLRVPTPPDAQTDWPGVVTASVTLP